MGKGSIKLLYWVLIGFFVLLCAKINSIGLIGYDGGSNPFTAFDELIFLREVYNILNASNLKEFVLSVIAGKGYIYGRFNYMCDALIAAIPFYVFGTKGLVFAIRMAHAFYLILGFHLINRYINKELGLSRLLSLIVFFFFPYTLYFIGMPKPEPMQLLLIGLFFTFNSKDWAWLLLGLAFGSKISIAFGCLFLVGVILYQFYQKEINLRQFLNKAFYGLTGLIIALPALPLSLISPHFRNGLIKIVTTASKPYDNPKITFGDWIIRLLQYYDPLPFWLSAILVLIILICAALILRKHREYSSYVIFAALAIIPIMLFTKRLWVFYLFIGMVMLIPFVFRFASEIARKKKRYWRFTPLFILLPFLISFKTGIFRYGKMPLIEISLRPTKKVRRQH